MYMVKEKTLNLQEVQFCQSSRTRCAKSHHQCQWSAKGSPWNLLWKVQHVLGCRGSYYGNYQWHPMPKTMKQTSILTVVFCPGDDLLHSDRLLLKHWATPTRGFTRNPRDGQKIRAKRLWDHHKPDAIWLDTWVHHFLENPKKTQHVWLHIDRFEVSPGDLEEPMVSFPEFDTHFLVTARNAQPTPGKFGLLTLDTPKSLNKWLASSTSPQQKQLFENCFLRHP